MGRSFALLLLPWIAAAQLTPNSVTVTASRQASAAFDQVVFQVSLGTPVETSFDEAVAAVSAAGLTAANFTGVGIASVALAQWSSQPAFGQAPATWSFQLAVPFADMQKTVGLLQAVDANIAKEKKYSFSFRVAGVSASGAGAQACSAADLIADARTQAAALAGAAGATVGVIQSLSSSTSACTLTARFSLSGGTPSDAGTVTINATTPASTAAPSRFAVTLDVGAEAGTSFDEVLKVASAAGASAADLVGVTQTAVGRVCITTPCNPVEWLFRFTAPLAKWKETVAKLQAVATGKHPGFTVGYTFSADAPAAPECATPTLLSQAQKRATDFASAAGLRAGPVSSMALVPAPVIPTSVVPVPVVQSGDFSSGSGSLSSFLIATITTAPIAVPGCGLVATFPLLR